ncbi:hypothetical protein O6P43_026837 [Quillaja saponaria]|uniref:Uncharacterized protein n=1 Tax=Quillaja saponaria TaxID=32244 RepID=A0AAD7L3H4_QUISA|nr:hypothetical protein O6P43_026837 [Quillaja saponaria]
MSISLSVWSGGEWVQSSGGDAEDQVRCRFHQATRDNYPLRGFVWLNCCYICPVLYLKNRGYSAVVISAYSAVKISDYNAFF